MEKTQRFLSITAFNAGLFMSLAHAFTEKPNPLRSIDFFP